MSLFADVGTWVAAGIALGTAAIGAGLAALITGYFSIRASRETGGNKWLEFKRGRARSYLQHIAVHNRDTEIGEDDERLLGHYYTLALAVSDDRTAAALFDGLPENLRSRVHDPRKPPFDLLRGEVAPGRKALAPEGDLDA